MRMFVTRTVKNSYLRCPHCGCGDMEWQNIDYDMGERIYSETCPECEESFVEYCSDQEDEQYLRTTYNEYIKVDSTNSRW